MIKLNIHEAKTHLSKYLINLEKGETLLLCKRNQPIAEIRPLRATLNERRPIGLGKGTVAIPESFWEAMQDEELDLFEGKGG
ncbi:MAG: type II toxin-antitoxin system Phd/YefM family antitoxin [Betaproteobacteria bacterium]|nr:type II toxin-antitoxin system Phd/YefM family antitoxin [Betaproteobacteria bacterium]